MFLESECQCIVLPIETLIFFYGFILISIETYRLTCICFGGRGGIKKKNYLGHYNTEMCLHVQMRLADTKTVE